MLITPFPKIGNTHPVIIPLGNHDLITANCYLLGKGPLTLIDTGPKFAGGLELIRSGVKELGFHLQDIERIIITHGTYTMPDTGRYLKTHLKRKDQVIILTGSLIPMDGFSLSDANFNIGYSMAQLEHLKPGIYVCMNGRVFDTEEVSKLIQEGKFISLFGETEKN